MSRNNQQTMITALAMLAPLAHYAGIGYMAVLLAAGAMIPLTILAGDGLKYITKKEAVLEFLWIGIILGTVMPEAGRNWPGSKSEIAVPVTLLALAVISGRREKSQRVCTALYWIALVPVIMIGAVVMGQLEMAWLKPEPREWSLGLIVVLLYPALQGINSRVKGKTGIAIALIALALAVAIQGGLGIKTEDGTMYELGRCIGNGGFEIIISAILTLSWYGFAVVGMESAASFGEKLGISAIHSRIGVGILSGILIITGAKLEGWIAIAGCLVLWILLPIIPRKIKSKKDEKRC